MERKIFKPDISAALLLTFIWTKKKSARKFFSSYIFFWVHLQTKSGPSTKLKCTKNISLSYSEPRQKWHFHISIFFPFCFQKYLHFHNCISVLVRYTALHSIAWNSHWNCNWIVLVIVWCTYIHTNIRIYSWIAPRHCCECNKRYALTLAPHQCCHFIFFPARFSLFL